MRMPNIQLLSGETVTVLTPAYSYDEHMNEVAEWSEQEVPNVLVAPASVDSSGSEDVTDTSRLHGTQATFKLGFPKTFSDSLRGCHVVVRGREYKVVGDPQPNTLENCPTFWWYTAEVVDIDG